MEPSPGFKRFIPLGLAQLSLNPRCGASFVRREMKAVRRRKADSVAPSGIFEVVSIRSRSAGPPWGEPLQPRKSRTLYSRKHSHWLSALRTVYAKRISTMDLFDPPLADPISLLPRDGDVLYHGTLAAPFAADAEGT